MDKTDYIKQFWDIICDEVNVKGLDFGFRTPGEEVILYRRDIRRFEIQQKKENMKK